MIPSMKGGMLAALALAAAACGGGGVGAGAALRGGGGGDAAAPAPRSTVSASPTGSNFVPLQYVLADDGLPSGGGRPGGIEDPRVHVSPEFRIGTGQWRSMTEAAIAGSEGTRGLPPGKHDFIWNTLVDLGGGQHTVQVRVGAAYEDALRAGGGFRENETEIRLDNRLATTVLGRNADPPQEVATVPVDLARDGSGFLVAGRGSNIVERVDGTGEAERILGRGIPGDTVGGGSGPGVARLPRIVGLAVDGSGGLWTAHESSILYTNRGPSPVGIGSLIAPDRTVVTVVPGLAGVRALRVHPSGLVLWLDSSGGAVHLMAFHPGAPSDPGAAAIELGGTTVLPGEIVAVAGGGGSTAEGGLLRDADLSEATAMAMGEGGEVYLAERDLGRARVLNLGTVPLLLGGNVVAPGTVETVAGGNGLGRSGDGGPPRNARFRDLGGLHLLPGNGLLIVDSGNSRVRLANLGEGDLVVAGTSVAPGTVQTVVGGDIGAPGSLATDLLLRTPVAIALDAVGNLLVSSESQVVLVNPGSATVDAFGRRVGAGRTAAVYDAGPRGGLPLQGPGAIHILHPQALDAFLTDRTTIRVLNLSENVVYHGDTAAEPGHSAVVAGGAVPGFSGDGGKALGAEYSHPSALASLPAASGADVVPLLFVADTGNDRIRMVHVGSGTDPATLLAFGVAVERGHVDTIVGGAPGAMPADGDGLPPRSASLLAPRGLAAARIQGAEVLFVADTGHHRVRVVNGGPGDVQVAGITVAEGTIGTILGDGMPGFTADGTGPWRLDTPTALAVHQGMLCFAENGNARIRVLNFGAATVRLAGIDVAPGEVRTLVGTGVRGRTGDGDLGPNVEVDSPGGLFFQTLSGAPLALFYSDSSENLIRVLNLTGSDLDIAASTVGPAKARVAGGSVATLAGGPNQPGFPNPPAFEGDGDEPSAVRFAVPRGVLWTSRVLHPAHFLVADEGNDRIRRFEAAPTRSGLDVP